MTDSSQSGRRLESWKDIAAYLRRDVRTVQRWEKREGLPVRRHLHHERATVFAFADEIDAWWVERSSLLAADAAGLAESIEPDGGETGAIDPPPGTLAPDSRSGSGVRLLLALSAAAAIGVGLAAFWPRWDAAPRADAAAIQPSPVAAPDLPAPAPAGRLFADAAREGGSLAVIPTGADPVDVALSRDGAELYVADGSDPSLAIIDTASARVIARVPLPDAAARLALSPDGTHLYAALSRKGLAAIDVHRRVARALPVADVDGIAVAPDGAAIFLARRYAGLARFDIAAGRLVPLAAETCPIAVTIVPRTFRLYTTYQCQGPGGRPGHDAVDVLDVRTGVHAGAIQGFPNVGGAIVASPDGRQIWVSGTNACVSDAYDREGCPGVPSSVITVIRGDDHVVLRTFGLPVEAGYGDFTFFPDGSRVLAGGRRLTIVDARRFVAVETLDERGTGRGAFSRDGRRLFAPVPSRGGVAVFLRRQTPAELAEGLVGFWSGDGAASDVRGDAHGALKNGAGFAPGRVGPAFSFDGRDDVVTLGERQSAPMDEPATFVAWVKLQSVSGRMTIADHVDTRGVGWRVEKDAANRLAFCMGRCETGAPASAQTARLTSRSVFEPGVWRFVAVTRDLREAVLYVDGVREASARVAADFVDPVCEQRFGASAAGGHLHGLLDEIAAYRRALTPAEVEAIYTSGAPRGGRLAARP